jgi:hypothetical protein
MNRIKKRISLHEVGNSHQPLCDPNNVINANKRVAIKTVMENRSKVSLYYLKIGKDETSARQILKRQT